MQPPYQSGCETQHNDGPLEAPYRREKSIAPLAGSRLLYIL